LVTVNLFPCYVCFSVFLPHNKLIVSRCNTL
jgi:hypothetical protein